MIVMVSMQLHAQWESFNTSNVTELLSNRIQSVVVSPDDNNKWFGTSKGLTRFDGNTWVTYTTASDNIASDSVNDISFSDAESSPKLWLSTQNGASSLTIESSGISAETPYQTSNSGIVSDQVYTNAISTAGNKLFGTEKGVSTLIGSNWKNITGTDSAKLAQYPVKSIGTSSDGYSYLGSTGSGIFQYQDDVDGVSLVTVYEIPWINVPSNTIFSVFVDKDGNQWYGSDAGASFHEGTEGKPLSTWTYYSSSDGLPNDTVNAIIEDSRGNIWFGTNDGLALKQGDEWTIFTEADGLASNKIYDIAEDKNQLIWIATDNGISSYTPPWAGIPQTSTQGVFRLTVHPNPAQDGVWIKYDLPMGGPTRLAVFDLSGRLIRQLQYGFNVAGSHEIFWNTAGSDGNFAEAGIYVVRIQINNLSTTSKLVILR